MKMVKKKGSWSNADKLPLVTDNDGSGPEFSDEELLNDDFARYELEEEKSLEQKLMQRRSKRKSKKALAAEKNSVFDLEEDSDSDSALPTLSKKKKKEEEDELASDLGDDDGEIDEYDEIRAWGRKKRHFYGGNEFRMDENADGNESLDENEVEAQESKVLQIKQLEQMDEDDFLDAFASATTTATPSKSKLSSTAPESIKLDVSKLSKKEKLELFKQESPEFEGIVEDFKEKMTEAVEVLAPIVGYMNQGKLPNTGPVAKFIKTKYNIILNYCTNISCYLLFKSKRVSLKFHPLSGRLVQYKQLLEQLKPLEELVMPQVRSLLKAVKEDGKSIERLVKQARKKRALKQRGENQPKRLRVLQKTTEKPVSKEDKISLEDLTSDERKAIELYEAMRSKKGNNDTEEEMEEEEEDPKDNNQEEDEEEDGERRMINYQIAKNKGLTPKRSKLQRNPRVKHRHKFEKALIRRKGQVRTVRKEIKKYGGEISGINARVKKGIKIM